MSILPDNYDYTAKDFDSWDARLKSLVLSVMPEYPVDAGGNPGNLFRELFAYTLDVVNYYQDNQARETFWQTLRQRKSALRKAKFLDYELSGASAATADLTLTIANGPLAGNTTIPAGTVVRTSHVTAPIRGELQADVVITAGNTTGTGSWEHSETKGATFTSTGLANQEHRLEETPYLDDSATITTAAGTWTEVDNFLSSTGSDRHYTIEVDHNDRATIKFGDGQTGAVPSGTITVVYKVGGGIEGNDVTLDVIEGTFADHLGNPATMTSANATSASGGVSRETVGEARTAAPNSLRTLTRCVTREDFEIKALDVAGVARALMVTSNEVSIAENTGILYIVPDGGGTASSALLASVETQVTTTFPPTVTFQLSVQTASYLTVDVVAYIWIRQGYTASAVKTAVETALAEFFEAKISRERTIDGTIYEVGEANPYVDFGWNYKDADGEPAGEIAWSDVQNAVRDVAGVRKVGAGETEFTLNGQRDDVSIANHLFPVLGTVTLYNGSTNTQI